MAEVIEILAAIDAPHFFAGIVLWDDKVVEAADIVKYMRRWPRSIQVVYLQERRKC
jgi:hypothetical protein